MKKEAEEHAEEDRKRKENIEARNNADTLIHTAEKTLKELKEKITKEDKENIDNAIKELREALTGDNVEKIKEKTEKLSEALQKASTALYQQAAQQHQQQTGSDEKNEETWKGHPSGDDDKTIDADYKMKDKKDKQ